MDLKATIASGYRNRLLLITIGALVYAAWAFYDASYKYPAKQEQFQAYKQTQQENPKDWNAVWAKKIEEKRAEGIEWEEQPAEVTDMSVATQWILFGITFPVGTLGLISLIRWSRRYIGADQTTLYASGGVEVPFDKITTIDAVRWENKGIARVRYDTGSGERELVIDDWKYQREPSDQIFARLREHVDSEQIVGLAEPAEAEDGDESDAEPSAELDKPTTSTTV